MKHAMGTYFKKAFLFLSKSILALLAGAIIFLVIIIFLYWQTNLVADAAEKYINYSLGDSIRVEYGTIRGTLFNSIAFDSLRVEVDEKMVLSVLNVQLSYDMWASLNNRIKISSVRIDSLKIKIISKPDIRQNTAVKPFNLDSLLASIQSSHFIDSLLSKMPHLELDDLEIIAGNLQVTGKELTFDEVNLKLSAQIKPPEFTIDLYHLSAYWVEKNLPLKELRFQLTGDSQNLSVNKFNLQAGDSQIELIADIELDELNTVLLFNRISLDEKLLNTFLPAIKSSGFIEGSFSFIGKPQDFAVNIKMGGNLQNHNVKNLHLAAEYGFGTIKIDTLDVFTNSGNVFLTTKINPARSAKGLIKFSGINVQPFIAGQSKSNINGSLKFNFPSGTFDINKLAKSFKSLTGKGELLLNNSFYGDYHLDSLRFALNAKKGDLEIEQPSYLQIASQARFDLYGSLNRKQEINFQVQTGIGDLNSLTDAVGIDSIYGEYQTAFAASGELLNPDIKGRFWIRKFIYKDILLDSVSFDMQTSKIFTSLQGGANFTISKGLVYDIPVRDVTLNTQIDSNFVRLSTARIFNDDNYIETSMDILKEGDLYTLTIDHLRMEYEKYWLQNETPVLVKIDTSMVQINNLILAGPGNTSLSGEGSYDTITEKADINFKLASINLEMFQQFLGEEHKFSGTLNGNIDIKDLLNEPAAKVDLIGTNIVYNQVKIGDFSGNLHYENKKIFVEDLQLKSGKSSLSVNGDLGLKLDKKVKQILDLIGSTETNLKVRWTNLDLNNYNPLMNLNMPVRGILSGYLEVEGTIGDPYMRQSLSLSRFKYDKFNVDSLLMFTQYSGGYMILDSLWANVEGTEFNAKGWQQMQLGLDNQDSTYFDNPFEIYLTSSDDHIDFIGHFNEQLESIKGDYDLVLNINGTPQNPGVSSGYITMDKGEILLSRVKDPIKNVNIDIAIENNVLRINSFNGKSEQEKDIWQKGYAWIRKLWSWILPEEEKEDGTLLVMGTINLENLLTPGFNLDIKTNEFYVDYFVENTKLLVSTSNLRLSGRDTLNIGGNVLVPYGEYIVDLAQAQKNLYLEKPVKDQEKPFLAMDLGIEIPGNFIVTSSALDIQNNFKISLEGNLQVSRRAGSENMSVIGVLETESGKFSTFNQVFDVTSGTITLNNPLRINPDLNIIARKRLREKIFELVITGNLEAIQQNFIVRNEETGEELNLSPQDKIALLTLGADLSMVSSNTDSTFRGVGEDIASNMLLTTAERGVEELTGLDRVQISSSDKFLSLQKMKLNNGLSQASISFGKYLTSDLYVEYRTQFGSGMPTPKLSWDAGNKISLQYRINSQWSLESQYEKTVPLGNNKINVGLSWEYSF